MELTPVQSSNIRAMGYEPDDENGGRLQVEFQNGRIYQYEGVEASVFEILMTSSSIGSAFTAFVKNAGYQYAEV